MSEIKRYSLTKTSERLGQSWMSVMEHPRGEWVKWKDVEGYIFAVEQMTEDLDLEKLKELLRPRPQIKDKTND
jgi:hypothetical protein